MIFTAAPTCKLESDVTVVAGKKLRLRAAIDGFPVPSVSWKFDDQNLLDTVKVSY